jgi:hypothetical protein
MFQKALSSIGLIAFSLLSLFTPSEMRQRPLRDMPSKELVERLYVDDLAQETQREIRERMSEVAIYGIDKDRELVEALLESLDSKNVKVKGEVVINLIIVQDQTVRKRLLQLLGPGNDGAIQGAVLVGIAVGRGVWPVDDHDIENIKSIILRPTQSIDGDFYVKDAAFSALGTLRAVAALEDLKKHERIVQLFGDSLDAALKRAREVRKNTPDQ